MLCLLLAGLSARQQAIWADNVTLWRHAVWVTPALARPAINLAVAYRKAGFPEHAATWLMVAGPLTVGDPREREYRTIIRLEFAMLESFGTFVCDQPTARPYC